MIFVHLRVADLILGGDPPKIHIIHTKPHPDPYKPILPALADEPLVGMNLLASPG